MSTILSARPPFSLSSVAGSHGWIRLAPFQWDPESQTLSYIYRLDTGRVVDLIIRPAEDGVRVGLGEGWNPGECQEVVEAVNWMLNLDQDLAPFYHLARSEPKLAQVEDRAQGRLLRCPTLFEDIIKTILTTNTSWGGTIRMAQALTECYGDPLLSDPTRHAFPTPDQLAITDEETLRTDARLGYRAPYVLELARRIAAGELDLETFKTTDLPTPDLRQRLLALKGVGPYAAAHLLMILGRYDFIPIDSWASKIVSHEWYDGQPVGNKEIEAAFERWGDWRGLAYWFWDWSYLKQD